MIENKRQTIGQYKGMEQVYMVTQNQKRWKSDPNEFQKHI
jgi:hypothetical protein